MHVNLAEAPLGSMRSHWWAAADTGQMIARNGTTLGAHCNLPKYTPVMEKSNYHEHTHTPPSLATVHRHVTYTKPSSMVRRSLEASRAFLNSQDPRMLTDLAT